MMSAREWFAPKRYGYGSGLPISWQGWAVMIVYVALLGLSSFLVDQSKTAYFSIVAILTSALIVICARTTRGGWRWRWGEED
jgi:hypothetical protein